MKDKLILTIWLISIVIAIKNTQKILKIIKNHRNYLIDGEVNPKEVLKSQERFKSDLSEIKIGGNKSPDQNNTIENLNLIFLEVILFYYLKISTKQSMEKDS